VYSSLTHRDRRVGYIGVTAPADLEFVPAGVLKVYGLAKGAHLRMSDGPLKGGPNLPQVFKYLLEFLPRHRETVPRVAIGTAAELSFDRHRGVVADREDHEQIVADEAARMRVAAA
jgi:hypothetical protein